MSHIKSYWHSTTSNIKKRKPLTDKIKTDVAIIGGGFSGLATSYFLNKSGVHTVLLEQNNIGWGASGRNAGMLTTGYKNSTESLSKKIGLEKAKELLEMSVDCINLVDQVATEENIDCSINYNGGLKLAYKPKHFDSLKREHEFMLENFEYETTIIEPKFMNEEINSPLYKHGALMDPHSFAFHPLKYAIGLGDAIEEYGGFIYEQSEAKSIKKIKNGYEIITPEGKVHASEVVIATNGYSTKSVDSKLARSIIPIDSHVITTEQLPQEVANRLIPKNRVTIDTKNFLYYFRVTEDRRLLFGGRVSFAKSGSSQSNPDLFEDLKKGMIDVFPELVNSKIDYQWGGTTAFTFDFMPHFGKTKKGEYYITGFCGHGAAMSTLTGKLIAKDIMEKSSIMDNELSKLPLRKIPFHSQHGKVLTIAESYMKLKDKFF